MSTSVSTNILDNLKLEVETIIDNKNLPILKNDRRKTKYFDFHNIKEQI